MVLVSHFLPHNLVADPWPLLFYCATRTALFALCQVACAESARTRDIVASPPSADTTTILLVTVIGRMRVSSDTRVKYITLLRSLRRFASVLHSISRPLWLS
jgi:hypothetical protein